MPDIEIAVVLGEYNRRVADLTQQAVILVAENSALKNHIAMLESQLNQLNQPIGEEVYK